MGVAVLLFIGAFFIATRTHYEGTNTSTSTPMVAIDAIETTNTFYNAWLSGRQSTTSNPYDMGLVDDASLTDEVRTYIRASKDTYTENDPVLCLPMVPTRIGAKPVFEASTTAQIMVIPRKLTTPTPKSAIVDLELIDYVWKITKISCSNGEEAPVSEFSFEKAGFVTKTLPAPYTAGTWHIVFTQDDGRIGATRLLFDANSRCTLADGVEGACNPDALTDGDRITIKSNLTEEGTLIKYLMVVQ